MYCSQQQLGILNFFTLYLIYESACEINFNLNLLVFVATKREYQDDE